MRKAEAVIVTILTLIITSIASMYIEREYAVTVVINNTLDSNNTIVKDR